jgi:hypothetical protein
MAANGRPGEGVARPIRRGVNLQAQKVVRDEPAPSRPELKVVHRIQAGSGPDQMSIVPADPASRPRRLSSLEHLGSRCPRDLGLPRGSGHEGIELLRKEPR